MRLDYTPPLWIALCITIVACSSAHRSTDDDAQPDPEQAAEPSAPAADAESAGHAAIARECIERVPGEEFCDDRLVRACVDGTASTVRQCGHGERCIAQRGGVSCACEPGSVDIGAGCQFDASCDASGGGCDPLTRCSVVAGETTCGPCPAGYAGDGQRGCEPLLTGLVVDGELTPVFSPDVRSYRVKLPRMREQLSLTPIAPSQAHIEVDGAELDPGSTWTSPVLAPGEHAIALVLISPSGVSTRYELIVERPE